MRNIFTPLFLLSFLISNAQDGLLDGTWASGGKTTASVSGSVNNTNKQKILILGDGSILQTFTVDNGTNTDLGVAKFLADGSLDPSFGPGGLGYVTLNLGGNESATSMALQSDGKIIVSGTSESGGVGSFALARFTTTGILDNTFGSSGSTLTLIGTSSFSYDVAIRPDDKIILGGTSSDGTKNRFALAQYTAAGVLDASNFGSGTGTVTTSFNTLDDEINGIVLKTDGSIVAAGYTQVNSTDYDFALAQYTSAGVLDVANFGGGTGKVTTDFTLNLGDFANDVIITSTGNILAGGYSDQGAGDYDFALAQYNSNGTLDASFGTSGRVTTAFTPNSDEIGYSLAIQADNKIILAGSKNSGGFPATDNDFAIARYNSNGSLDLPFGGSNTGTNTVDFGSTNDPGYSVALGSGYIMIGGITSLGGSQLALAKLVNSSGPLPVHLTGFTATRQSNSVLLNWQTQNELNVTAFAVERSSDGTHFTSIGQVQAAGNSSTTRNYSLNDLKPGAVNFYRLRIINSDGSVSFSQIVVVRFNGTNTLQAFPNPVHSTLNLQMDLPAGKISVGIFDASGKMVRSQQLQSAGNALSTSVDMSSLRNGVYFIRVNDQTVRILKN